MVGVGVLAMCVSGVIDLIHIRVSGGLPCGCPHLSGVGFEGVVPGGGANVVYLQSDANLFQLFGSCNRNAVSGMILNAFAGDHALIGEGCAFGSGGEGGGSFVPGEACGLEEADGGLQGGFVLLLVVHAFGVDGIAFYVNAVAVLVAFVGGTGSCPGSVGDGILDDGGAVAVVGIDHGVAIDGEEGHEGLAQVLGFLAACILADLYQICVDAQVAVAAIVNQVGGNHVAGQFAVGVGGLQGADLVSVQGGDGDVESAGYNAGDVVGFGGFLHQQGLGCRSAQEVVGVGLQGDNAVVIALEGVGAAANGLGGLCANDAQIALREAEGAVFIIIQGFVAVVVQGSDVEAHVVDGGGVILGHVHGHGVVAGADDAGDGVDGIACGYAVAILGGVIGNEIEDGGTGGFNVGSLDDGGVAAFDGSPVIGNGSALEPGCIVAPQEHAQLYLQRRISHDLFGGGFDHGSIVVDIVGYAVVNDFLGEQGACGVNICPESGLDFFRPYGEVGIVAAGLNQQGGEGGHGAVICFHAFDGQGIDGGGAIIGGVCHDIDAEDHVINVGGHAIGELDIVTHGQVVVYGAVIVHDNFYIAHAVIGVISAVVVHGFALDTVADHVAAAVGCEQGALGQADNVHVIGVGGEEGAELLAEGRGAEYDGIGAGFGGFCHCCAGKNHQHSQQKG